jgi:hypothetical protein
MLRSNKARAVAAVVVVVGLALGLVTCKPKGSGTTTTTTAPTTTSATTTTTTTAAPSLAAPCGRTATPPTTYEHVVMLLEENRTWTGGRTPSVGMGFGGGKMPFLAGLATKCAYFTDWAETDGTQNSLNQYIGLTSGVANSSTVNDCAPSATCRSTDDNIFRQVRTAGGTARSYVDGATTACSAGSNAAKHIPALYYQGGDDASHCTAEVRPWSDLDPDHLPTYAFLSPDLCHDGHDCPDATVDDFAETTLTAILDGATYREGKTLVVVVYDEDQPVPNLLIAPTAKAGPISSVAGSHAALLKTTEQLLGLPVMAQGQLPTAISLRSAAGI